MAVVSTPARVVRLSLIAEQWAIHCFRVACPPEWRRHASNRLQHITQSLRLFLGRRSRRGEPAAIIQIVNTRHQIGGVCLCMCETFTSGSNRRCGARRSIPWARRRRRRLKGEGTRIDAYPLSGASPPKHQMERFPFSCSQSDPYRIAPNGTHLSGGT